MPATDIQSLTGAKIVTETFKKLGVDSIFGYPGGIVLNVYDELYKQNNIKHYLVRHEQAAVHAAEGYARVTGKCGVALVTSGPGATNIVTGLANAYLDGYPLVVITGQVMADLIGKDAFQEVDIIDITKTCTKKNFQVRDAKYLEAVLVEAFNTAISGKQGPVVVDIAKNVFSQEVEFDSDIKFSADKNCPFDFEVKNALKAVCKAKRPVIVAGGGVVSANAAKELTEFAKLLNIPVVNTMMGIGSYPYDDKNNFGMIGIFGQVAANQLLRESDMIFSVGARFNDRIRCCFPNGELERNFVQIDINENEISRIIPASIGISGDAKYVLQKMITEVKLNNLQSCKASDWLVFADSLRSKNIKPEKRTDAMHSFEVMQKINEFIQNKNPVVTTEVGQHQVWAARYLKFNETKKFITSGGSGTMGFGFPAAIGACIADNNNPVFCIAGDGSFQMNIQELATCVDYNLPVKVLIMNNGYLGMVRQFQEKTCGARYSATRISNPDFLKTAESYGILGIRVNSVNEIFPALEKAYAYNGPVLVDFVIEPEEIL